MPPKLVIFDCDGVLVDTETKTALVMSKDLGAHGLEIAPQEVHELFQGGTMFGAKAEAEKRGARLPDDWVELINEQVKAALADGVTVFDGLFELLDLLDTRGIATAVASNGPMDKMAVSLGPSGLYQRFEGRIFSGRQSKPKPAPDMLLLACAQAGVASNEAVMIDDTTAGTRAAEAAGMPAIGFSAASDAEKLRATGHPVAANFAQVTALLGLTG